MEMNSDWRLLSSANILSLVFNSDALDYESGAIAVAWYERLIVPMSLDSI